MNLNGTEYSISPVSTFGEGDDGLLPSWETLVSYCISSSSELLTLAKVAIHYPSFENVELTEFITVFFILHIDI